MDVERKTREGVNVDRCTRYAEAAMCGDQRAYARKICAIPDERQKVRVFRGKTEEEVERILVGLSEEIRKSIIARYYCDEPGKRTGDIVLTHSSDDNRKDADLYHVVNGRTVSIEVKFGSETNRNVGMGVFEKVFGTDVFSDALSRSVRTVWEKSFVADGRDESAQYRRLWNALNAAIHGFNEFQAARNCLLPAPNQAYMEKTILNTTGDGTSNGEFMKFVLDGDDFRDLRRIPTGIGKWTVRPVPRVDGQNVSRCNVIVRNDSSKVRIKYVLNWKNDHPLLGNRNDMVPAKLGLGTPSWNVWVRC